MAKAVRWKELLEALGRLTNIPADAVVHGVTIPEDADMETLEYVLTCRGRNAVPYSNGVEIKAQRARRGGGLD